MRCRREERGVAVVEFLMTLPFLFVAVLGVIQVGVVAAANSSVEEAARAAAHASRNGADPHAAAQRATGSSVTHVQTWRVGSDNHWTARGHVRTVLPGINHTVEKSVRLP